MFSKNAFKSFVKQCLAEVIVETTSLVLTPTGQSDDWSRPIYKSPSGRTCVDINCGEGTPDIYWISDYGEPMSPVKNYQIVSGNISSTSLVKQCPKCKGNKVINYTKKALLCPDCGWKTFNDLHAVLRGEESPKPIDEAKLICNICGGHAKGKQWFNQDKGYGICSKCANDMIARGQEDIAQSYGKAGVNYHIANDFIKECVLEVLKENLSEGFDPQSQGPNGVDTTGNPYAKWNSDMRKMEEENEPNYIDSKQEELSYYINNSGLTYREKGIIQDKLAGNTCKEIAEKWHMSAGFAQTLINSAIEKLQTAIKKHDSGTALNQLVPKSKPYSKWTPPAGMQDNLKESDWYEA